MIYNFDEVHNRENTSSIKWNKELFSHQFGGHKDLLPMWVADMDFKVSKGITDRLAKLVSDGIFGYAQFDKEYYDAIIKWHADRYQLKISAEEIVFTPGIVPALNYIVQTFTHKGDGVLIQPPVYYPFKNAIVNNGRVVVNSPLIETAPSYYEMDYADIEKKIIAHNIKLFIFCSPHNPVGRVWKKEELQKLADICLKHKILVISDEIHCDLTFFGHKHTPFISLSEEVANITILCNAVSKTFNLAGVQISNIIIRNPDIRKKYKKTLEDYSLTLPNVFAIEAAKGAMMDSIDWYDQMIAYIEGNITFAADYISKNIPILSMKKQEGTYLGWIDARKLKFNNKQMQEFLETKAKVALDYGHWFGEEGEGFIRINLACTRATLEKGLSMLKNAINSL